MSLNLPLHLCIELKKKAWATNHFRKKFAVHGDFRFGRIPRKLSFKRTGEKIWVFCDFVPYSKMSFIAKNLSLLSCSLQINQANFWPLNSRGLGPFLPGFWNTSELTKNVATFWCAAQRACSFRSLWFIQIPLVPTPSLVSKVFFR